MAAPLYTTAANILTRIADTLGTAQTQLLADAPQWTGYSNAAEASANGIIHRAFLAKGYTSAQIFDDPAHVDLATRVGVCQAFRQAVLANIANIEAVKLFCTAVEEEIKNLPLAGEEEVAAPTGPVIGYGRMNIAECVDRLDDRCCW